MENAVDFIKKEWPEAKPLSGLILGSGWGSLVSDAKEKGSLPYDKIPGLGKTGVEGHSGTLRWIEMEGVELLMFSGRRHYYEGVGWGPIRLPIRLLKQMGAKALVVTNAAGGINSQLDAGDIMLLEDHINFMGSNPLIGPQDEDFGERFPNLTQVYDRQFMQIMSEAGEQEGLNFFRGVYLAASGPAYETPAEVKAYRALGADAVGMSTVPEAMLAHAAGLRVLGMSCIANKAVEADSVDLGHEEVVRVCNQAVAKASGIFPKFLREMVKVI